jgi:hypothetical protein
MLKHLPNFDFGKHIFIDFFHLFELGVAKRQLEATFASMSTDNFKVFTKRMEKEEVSD